LVTDDAPFNLGSILAFMCFDLVGYFFLKLSKIDISENLKSLAQGPVWPASLDRRGRIETEQ
jgi:hypothetical protein